MIIVKILGGLGNQMFQYAYAKALQQKGYDVKLDISEYETYKLHGGYQLDKYAIDIKLANNIEVGKFYKSDFLSQVLYRLNFMSKNVNYVESLVYDEGLLKLEDNSLIEGYFQSEKFFLEIREELLVAFSIKNTLSNYTNKIKNKINLTKNSCSLHIRRGDYVSNSDANKVHGTCDLDYYKNAMQKIENFIGTVSYFIFSDDIVWVKENLKISNAIYIENLESRIPHEDIYLMSLCQHNIIANSSFSWWGAWLNQHDEKIVIAPKRWFADKELFKQSDDIVCKSWIKL